MAAAQGPQGGGGTTSNTSNQSQDIELQGIVADGVLGGLPVAEQNQEYFIVFKGVGGTGPEIIAQTAYFIEYLVDSDGNIFKPTENTSALNNLLQNFPIQKPVSVILDEASNASSNLGGKIELTAVGLQTPILYSQTGSSAGAYTGSLFFKGDPTLGIVDVDTTLTVPDMQAYMVKTTGFPTSNHTEITSYGGFEGGTPAFTTGNARSASLAAGRYIVTSSAAGDLLSFNIQSQVKVKNIDPTHSRQIQLRFKLTRDSVAIILNASGFILPANSEYVVLEHNQEVIVSDPLLFQQMINGDFFQLIIEGEVVPMTFDYIKFGVNNQGTLTQNPTTDGSLLQSAGSNAPPFWLTGSNNDLYITASDWLSTNYQNVQETENAEVIGSTWNNYNLSPVKVPFVTKVGDRIRFLYNPTLDFHIYDVKEPQDETDGRLKLKLNTILSQSLTETNMSNFVLHRTDVSLPKYVILNVDKSSGIIDTTENPFTGIILPQFPSEKLLNNLDSILNKLKVEGIIEN